MVALKVRTGGSEWSGIITLGGGSSHETEERHAFGDSDVPPWPLRNYDGSPEREGGCLGALVGLLALPVASIVGALFAVMN